MMELFENAGLISRNDLTFSMLMKSMGDRRFNSCTFLSEKEVDLQFEDGALTAIAEKALEKDTGARALRAIIEKFMLDIMYEIPKDDNIGRVTITEDYIRNNGAPLIEMRPYLQLEQKKKELASMERKQKDRTEDRTKDETER